MTPTIAAQFNLNTNKLRITDTFNYGTIGGWSSVYGNANIKIGNTLIHNNTNFDSSADIVIGTNTYKEFDLPLGQNGKPLNGSYSIVYTVQITGGAGAGTFEQEFQYQFDYCTLPVLDLCTSHDCYYAQLTATDTTKYPAGITLTRTLSIQFPRNANGTAVATPITTTNASKTIGAPIWSGGYTISLTSEMSYTQTDELIIVYTSTVQQTPSVYCDASLCGLFNCINSLRKKYTHAVRVGGRDISSLQQQNFIVGLFLDSIRLAIDCKDTKKATALTTELTSYLEDGCGCDCGCGCGSDDHSEPTLIYPLFSSAEANVVEIEELDPSFSYNTGKVLMFEGQEFRVISPTTAGQTPNTNRNLFSWLGGSANISNTASSGSGQHFLTLNKTSGRVTFVAPALSAGASDIFAIVNSCLASYPATAKFSVSLEYPINVGAQGQPIIVNQNGIDTIGDIMNFTIKNIDGANATNRDIVIVFNIEE